jgi:hypothetical protein
MIIILKKSLSNLNFFGFLCINWNIQENNIILMSFIIISLKSFYVWKAKSQWKWRKKKFTIMIFLFKFPFCLLLISMSFSSWDVLIYNFFFVCVVKWKDEKLLWFSLLSSIESINIEISYFLFFFYLFSLFSTQLKEKRRGYWL